MYSVKLEKMFALGTAVLLALGLNTAYADCASSPPPSGWSCSDNNNFTMLTPLGGATGGTNDVTFTWAGTYKLSVVTDGTNNATLSSPEPFFGVNWDAHHVNVYGPGTYVFDTTCPAGNPSCGTGTAAQKYTLVVPAGYVGAHMLFDWSGNNDIDVVQLWKTSDSWTATTVSADPTRDKFNIIDPNANNNSASTVWTFVSIDTPDSIISPGGTCGANPCSETNLFHGTWMMDGPFKGYSANFNVNATTGSAETEVLNTINMAVDTPGKMPTGGCSINSRPDKFGNRADWWLVAGFIAWLGLVVRRRRQNQA